jgi:hypothetical protein
VTVTSRWNDPAIRERAPYLRAGRNKGVRAAVREAKRFGAEDRNEDTLPERRSRKRKVTS